MESKTRNSFSPSPGQAGVQPSPGQQGSITMCNGDLGRQTPSLQMSPPSFFFPQLYMLGMTSYGLEYRLGQLGSAVSPPGSLCPPSLLAGGVGGEAEKASALCEHCSAITKSSLCYQHCFQHKCKTQLHASYCEEN